MGADFKTDPHSLGKGVHDYQKSVLAGAGGVAAVAVAGAAAARSPNFTAHRRNGMIQITRGGSQPSRKGLSEYFTGAARIDPLFQAPDPTLVGAASVIFEPGARTAWHASARPDVDHHIRVRLGSARGRAIEEVLPGDVVWFPPGLKHWHRATPTIAMSHIAIQESLNGKNVDWMEKVSNEQYRK
jgi:quercetin dioxygenase-like cupin family protein